MRLSENHVELYRRTSVLSATVKPAYCAPSMVGSDKHAYINGRALSTAEIASFVKIVQWDVSA